MTSLLLIAAAFLVQLLSVQAASNRCLSTTDAIFHLPDTPLTKLNKWLKRDPDYQSLLATGCPSNRDDGAVCFDKPAIGSGLAQIRPNKFLGLTDRGPNQDCQNLFQLDSDKYADAEGKDGKGFPVKNFAPTILHFKVDAHSRVLNTKRFVPLRGSDGQPITGLSNTEADDTPYGANCAGDQLSYDPSGLDPEDLARIPGTDYVVIVEEYSPSVVVANFKTGVIVVRHVPTTLGDALSAARYPIVADIPAVYTNRRKNRGFEGVVVDKEGKYVIAILQSPMLGDDEDSTVNNSIIRCAYFDLTVGDVGVPSLNYSMTFVIEASPPAAYVDSRNVPKDLKYSGGQYAGTNKFIALERAKGQVKLFLVDFSKVTNIDNTKYADNLDLEAATNGEFTAKQVGVRAADKTLIWDSADVVGGSIDFTGSSKQEGFVIDTKDPTKVWMIADNDFGLEGNENAEMRKLSLGRSVTGVTVCPMPEHPPAPVINVEPSKAISLKNPSTFRVSNEPDVGAAETLDVDERKQRAYVANEAKRSFDMYDVSTSPVTPLDSYEIGARYKPTSVSNCKKYNRIAVAFLDDEDEGGAGRIDILTKDLKPFLKIRNAECILPDHVKWSEDCKFLVAACEGEGVSVPGGVLVADFGGPKGKRYRGSKVGNFKGYDKIAESLVENGIRLVESMVPSVDLEPEYVAIYGNHAFVTIQEANAIGVVDLFEGKVTELKPIGFIDRSRDGFGIDASDKDGGINIKKYGLLYGMPQPDTIVGYKANDGLVYLVFANEGDAKDDVEEARGKDITDVEELNRNVAPGLKKVVENEEELGRLKFSTIMGYNNSTNTQEKMFHFGSRSFSIMGLDGTVVFDSGEWFSRIQERQFREIFNSNGFNDEDFSESQADLFDTRSDDKGMEPESVAVMRKDGRTYGFIGFERSSIIVVFDISNARSPVFVDAVQNHVFNESAETVFSEGRQGDLDPEGLFGSAKLGKLFVASSVSSTFTVYDIESAPAEA